jgi:hypothetical protein
MTPQQQAAGDAMAKELAFIVQSKRLLLKFLPLTKDASVLAGRQSVIDALEQLITDWEQAKQ